MEISRTVKIDELVERDYRVLQLLERLGLSDCFGDCTLEDACEREGLDPDTFILLYNVCSDASFRASEKSLREGDLDTVLRYLHNSHGYYQEKALISLSEALERLIAPCSEKQKQVIWRFFNDYKSELEKHFEHEEGHVLHYIKHLLDGHPDEDRNIDHIDDCCDNISEKISDLKSLVLKSLPAQCNGTDRLQTLYLISALKEDLDSHTRIEEDVLDAMIRLKEYEFFGEEPEQAQDDREELTDREKEILIGVATGLLNKEIADKYNISIHTVITHRKNITRKTGVKSVAGLTVYALLNGLIDINSVE